MINDRQPNNIKSPTLVKTHKKIVLSAFNSRPPYTMNQHIFLAPYGKWQFWFIHCNGEEKVDIPVLDIFFEENFDLPPPSTPLPSLPASAFTIANPPPTPSMHHYPPST
ncbi:hypothetical protein M422DRAFT_276986 [Sphaerobolus stellatus SS14]|uniref:Uncharacterized protein n=1 Tax=Sphaerobolus stellatus (strain SS14) TaxID=990650 RepID=A0A0C9UAM2_SPHS4|nr:hypothetical protein M422DRAFT_276986 [Sphaerobolus stellatus SS14]